MGTDCGAGSNRSSFSLYQLSNVTMKPNYQLMTEKDLNQYLSSLDKAKIQYPLHRTDPTHKKNYNKILKMEWEVIRGYFNNH